MPIEWIDAGSGVVRRTGFYIVIGAKPVIGPFISKEKAFACLVGDASEEQHGTTPTHNELVAGRADSEVLLGALGGGHRGDNRPGFGHGTPPR